MASTPAQGFPIAVAGATGLVGEALLEALAESAVPVEKLYALGRGDDAEATVLFAERPVAIEALADFDFGRCRLAFFCVPAEVARQHVPRAIAAGCHVIDVSAQFRLQADVPLVATDLGVPVLNGAGPHLIAAPGALALQVATLLRPLADAAGLVSVAVTALTSVSARGRAGVDELAGQTARLLNAQSIKPGVFPTQIAFNAIPAFEAIDASGFAAEELETAAEVRKLLADETLAVDISQVFVPVFYGHGLMIRVETRTPLAAAAAQRLLGSAPGVAPARGKKPFGPVDLGGEEPAIRIARIRQSAGSDRVLTLWSVADNVRKGAAVNSVQIAVTLLKPYL